MDKIENIARLKTTDIKRLELTRKRLKISGTFISQCLGLSNTAWSTWVTQRGSVPAKYLDQVTNILQTVGNLQNGERCLAVQKTNKKKKELDLDLIIEFLESVHTPKIPLFSKQRTQDLEKLLEEFAEDAGIILELIQEHKTETS